MVRRAMATGDIYKGSYAGWYCPGDNEFKTESQLVDGRCPDHPTLELQWLEEENYFFRLSRTRGARTALPRQSVLLRAGALPQRGARLAQRGVYRLLDQPRRRNVGHPVSGRPGAPHLVWFDALTNYLTGAGFPEDEGSFDALVAGRRPRHRQEHHALPLPVLAGHADERRFATARSSVFAHGFMLDKGERWQDAGNIMDPERWWGKFGVDGVRYVVLRRGPVRTRC